MHLVEIFTDGSCHTQKRIGAWAAIVFIDNEKAVLSGIEEDTTHNRMELVAVIKALEFIVSKTGNGCEVKIVSDSQYVVGLPERKAKFAAQNYLTKGGKEIQNKDLVKELMDFDERVKLTFEKIKAHQKKSTVVNYNIEADKLCRKMVREKVKVIG
jgi:ribonuclease HI